MYFPSVLTLQDLILEYKLWLLFQNANSLRSRKKIRKSYDFLFQINSGVTGENLKISKGRDLRGRKKIFLTFKPYCLFLFEILPTISVISAPPIGSFRTCVFIWVLYVQRKTVDIFKILVAILRIWRYFFFC